MKIMKWELGLPTQDYTAWSPNTFKMKPTLVVRRVGNGRVI
jgi:hypothetical protein